LGGVKPRKRNKKKNHVFFRKEQFLSRWCQSWQESVYFFTAAFHAKFSLKSDCIVTTDKVYQYFNIAYEILTK
jgi:hypothetical protein